jgi:hypothetical protein
MQAHHEKELVLTRLAASIAPSVFPAPIKLVYFIDKNERT